MSTKNFDLNLNTYKSRENDLIHLFGLDQSLNTTSAAIRNLRLEIDSFENEFRDRINYKNKSRDPQENNIQQFYLERNLKIPSLARNQFLLLELKNNSLVVLFSLSSYFYFTKISNYLNKVNSLSIFKPIFLTTFCFAPLGVSLYNTKINWEFYKLTFSTANKNKSKDK